MTLTLTSAGAHDGHGAVGDIGGGELPGEGGHGGLEPGEHDDGDPERWDMSGMADTESGTEAAALRSREKWPQSQFHNLTNSWRAATGAQCTAAEIRL